MKPVMLLLTTAILTCGCSSTLRFRTVDSATGAPVEDVAMHWSGTTIRYFGPSKCWDVCVDRHSDTNGFVSASGVSRYDNINRFYFRKDGYCEVTAFYLGHISLVEVFPDVTTTNRVSPDSLILIPMQRTK